MELERFGELERKIREIVDGYSALKHRNQELETLLEEQNARLGEVERRIQTLNEQKDAVRTKVDALLGMLHDIEVS